MTLEEYRVIKDKILAMKSKCFVNGPKDCIFPEKCAACTRDNCCRHSPCAFAPEEFLDLTNRAYMKKLLETRLIIIAPVDYHVLGIRARGTKDPATMAATEFVFESNPCALLTKNGCVLDYLFRPTEGLLVIPEEKICPGLYEHDEKANDWKAYKKYIDKLVARYGDRYLGYGPITSGEIEEYKRLLLKL